MATPHKHAALIKAWADGAQIQVLQNDGTWETVKTPEAGLGWYEHKSYRVKPETKRARMALVVNGLMPIDDPWIVSIQDTSQEADWRATGRFIKWIGDWVEYEV